MIPNFLSFDEIMLVSLNLVFNMGFNWYNLYTVSSMYIFADLIDPVKDAFPPMKYIEEEDPHLFVSKKTGRGPLKDDWLETCKNAPGCDVMCAYKLIKVEFKYWGMQVKYLYFLF